MMHRARPMQVGRMSLPLKRLTGKAALEELLLSEKQVSAINGMAKMNCAPIYWPSYIGAAMPLTIKGDDLYERGQATQEGIGAHIG